MSVFGILREKLKVWCQVIGGRLQALFGGTKPRVARPSVKPRLQELEPLVLPSASALTPSDGAAVVSQMVAAIDQEIAMVAKAVTAFDQMLVQVYTEDVSYFDLQAEHLLGLGLPVPNPAPTTVVPQTSTGDSSTAGSMPVVSPSGTGSGRGNSRGVGKGSSTTPADNTSTSAVKSGPPPAGGGAGSSDAIAHENAASQAASKAMALAGTGSGGTGSGGSGGTGTGSAGSGGIGSGFIGSGTGTGSATIYGQVWLDNNGDGSKDNGEMGYSDITVGLLNSAGQVIASTTTDPDGDYKFTLGLAPLSNYQTFQVQVYLNSVPNLYFQATLRQPNVSQINAKGTSGVFELASGGWRNINAGICSMTVTTLDDDPDEVEEPDVVTLRDAIETGNNGDGLNQFFAAQPIMFMDPQTGGPLSGTIKLQAALPAIAKSYDIEGPGSSTLTVQGNGNAGNQYTIFTVNAGVITTISGLSITGGFEFNGGGIYNNGDLTLNSDQIYNNQASNVGGGIYNPNGALLDCTFRDFLIVRHKRSLLGVKSLAR